jgi:hypothetical protein
MVQNMTEEALSKIEAEIKVLRDQLEVYKEARPVSFSCKEIREYIESAADPFSTSFPEPNRWHKNPSGGGCSIL